MTPLYRLALRAFPARHRATYAGEMVEAFEGLLATRRREHGPQAVGDGPGVGDVGHRARNRLRVIPLAVEQAHG